MTIEKAIGADHLGEPDDTADATLLVGGEIAQNDVTDHESHAPDEESLLTPAERETLRNHERLIRDSDFIEQWVAYCKSRTDAPVEIHHANALALMATAVDRNACLALRHKTIYPSLFLLVLAESGQRKSTPMKYAEDALTPTLPNRMLANDYSPEALIEDLASRSPSRGTAIVDEAGRLLSTMRRDRYGEGLKDLLSALWDAPDRLVRRLRQARFNLQSTYVNVVLALTPSRFLEVCTPEDVVSGFLARFLPVVPKARVVRKPLGVMTPETQKMQEALTAKLARIRHKWATAPREVAITHEALARLDEAERQLDEWADRQFHAELIRPWARRLSEYGVRLAILYSVSEEISDPVGAVWELPVLRALAVIDRIKNDVCRLVEDLLKDRSARELDKVERFIRANPGISGRDLQRRTSLRSGAAWKAVRELETQGRTKIEGGDGHYKCFPSSSIQTES